jgi:uncharacterized protein (TIGR02466 family)
MTTSDENVTNEPKLEVAYHFPCAMYLIERPDFLESVTEVSEEYLEKSKKEQDLDEIYPVVMSGNYYDDSRIEDFASFVGETAWNILSEQGYDMSNSVVSFSEMWTQEHHKHSSMEQHVHGYGAQIIGFYFLETPENCSRVVFHDPRPGKVQIDLPEQDFNNATLASKMINFEPRPGLLMFSNSWLPHAFTKHANEDPIKFVHFNLNVQYQPSVCPNSDVEII